MQLLWIIHHIDLALPLFSDGDNRRSHFEPAHSSKHSKRSLVSHVSLEGAACVAEEDNTCPFCGEVLATSYLLKRHMSTTHNQQLPFRCHLCGKGFLSSSGLRHHKHGSHMTRCFVCDFCGARFKHKHHMKDHVRKFHAWLWESVPVCHQIFKKKHCSINSDW